MRGSCPLFTHRQGQPQRGVFVGTGGGGAVRVTRTCLHIQLSPWVEQLS